MPSPDAGNTINMFKKTKSGDTNRRPNPLIWISLIVSGAIIFFFMGADRGNQFTEVTEVEVVQEDNRVEIDRSRSIRPGTRAREYIAEVRAAGEPFPLASIFERGSSFQQEGNLADAHLLFFYSAREGYIPAMMKMAEMSDPTLFRAEVSLLDNADAIQAYKWYQKAAALGHSSATDGVNNLMQWAVAESKWGNPQARQLLLNFKQ
jgi:hypothetical protein